MHVVASRGLVKVFFNLLLSHHCFPILLPILSYHYILCSDLGYEPKKVAQIPGTLAQNCQNESLNVGRQASESDYGFMDVVMPIA